MNFIGLNGNIAVSFLAIDILLILLIAFVMSTLESVSAAWNISFYGTAAQLRPTAATDYFVYSG